MIRDHKVIRLLNKRNRHDEHIKQIRNFRLTKECGKIIDSISEFYDDNPDEDGFTWSDLRNYLHVEQYPTAKEELHDIFDLILDQVEKEEVDLSVVTRLNELTLVDEVSNIVDTIKSKSNTNGVEELSNLVNKFEESCVSSEDNFINMDINHLVDKVIKGPGVEWRLEDLNESIGQVHEGDNILIVKRPETGGTTFLTSEFTHMLDQLPDGKSAVIFNNEEGGEKIGLRVLSSALNASSTEIEADPDKIKADYKTFLNGREIAIYDKSGMSYKDIERVLKQHPEYWLVGINVLAKVQGWNRLDGVARLQAQSEFTRSIAKKGHAVMSVLQADAEAEGKQFLTQSNVHGSKTDVAGEADVMIMIGKDPDSPGLRYISITKNKKPTTGRMIPSNKHAKFSCNFDEERGRYTSTGGS